MKELKIIVTTSDQYKHLIPIFCYLFNLNWDKNQKVEIVGYEKPDCELPSNFTFYSLGKQSGNKKDFSNDLRPYFEKQDSWFIWLFEDTFIKGVDWIRFLSLDSLMKDYVGRINLSKETVKQDYIPSKLKTLHYPVYENTQTAKYRLSTQPSIWNKEFLLKYLKPNLSPWDFETQESINDGWMIVGLGNAAVKHNEGVCKKNIYDYNFDGFPQETVDSMKQLNII